MSKKLSKKRSTPSRSLNPVKWLWRHKFKLSLILLLAIGAYGLYLDARIKQRMNGNTWQVPAQIYARPLTLQVGEELSIEEVVEELEWLAYRRVVDADSSGEYSIRGNQLAIYRRAFEFADGEEPERKLRLSFSGGELTEIRDSRQGAQRQIRLEPWLVTRFTNSSREDRMLVQLEDVPRELTDMLMLVEDRDFYQHHGIAPLSIARALIANISAGRAVQGGSTLTQQLIKNLFLTQEKSLTRKANEALMALLIELRYSKEEILQAYLNEVFLGQNGSNGVHGFGLASYFYFDRPLNELSVPEMAMLVGIIKGPSYYNPRRAPERVLERRNLVLRLLFEERGVAAPTYASWLKSPLGLSGKSALARGKHPAFMDRVRRELHDILPNPDMHQAGIKIFTTLDPLAQRKAELAVRNGLDELERHRKLQDLEAAMVVTDIASGEIRAMIGSRQTDFEGFNRALDARRSIGSIIKPVVYLTALEQPAYYNLASQLKDEPIHLKSNHGQLWSPQNSDKQFRGQVSLLTALSRSLNVPTVTLGMEVGLDEIAYTLKRLGVESPVSQYPALTLGAAALTPLEVNQMYQTLANEGLYVPLHSIDAVTDAGGNLIWRQPPIAQRRADPQAVYLINYALNKVTREGTAKVLKDAFPRLHLAGKTGTTDDYRDSWYAGFDRHNLVTIWLGKDNNDSTGLAGATGALPLYMDYQKRQHPKSLVRPFPAGLGIAHFDTLSGQHLEPGCPGSVSVPAVLSALTAPKPCAQAKQPVNENKKSFWERLFGS
ncbi:penicillin-binding protein 1B [Bowmanella dokdonensis]|uniref:Penicillin-binding protein 1B n=1 Tax=Bowmanella dokdonensis TaxID=751969 RepID=A0A939IPH5_9ALTE|nr:penicillin-binding protein 1B [Bowmanella dokdonensis]MBN7823994.1 penicillin-binding protein 1B [Bowmanella dokdonensis]